MATTSPDNIWTPDSGDDYALTVDLAAMADTVQDALTSRPRTYRTGTDSERLAVSGPDLFEGLRWYSTDSGLEWVYDGTAWRMTTPLRGTVTGASVPANNYLVNWATITFPVAFEVAPLVFLTVVESGLIQRLTASVQERTPTQAVVTMRNVSGAEATTPTVQWMAIAP